jgi:hypothetical protein
VRPIIERVLLCLPNMGSSLSEIAFTKYIESIF